mgnify:FL=1
MSLGSRVLGSGLDVRYMYQALALSLRAAPWPNPRVGAVLVNGGKIIATGYHKKRGSPHAEKVAIASVKNKKLLNGSTIYVTLEPCCHEKGTNGKLTPPCMPAIVRSGISRVVIGMKDPNPNVNGQGITALKKAGIDVRTGLLEKEISESNKPYLKLTKTKMPYVTLKCAVSLDGKLATKSGDSKWLSSPASRVHAHRLRAENDAILVGINTVLKDDPRLTTRLVKGRNPIRIILDGSLKIPLDAKVLADGNAILITTSEGMRFHKSKVNALRQSGAKVISAGSDEINLKAALRKLASLGIATLLVEGGGKTISSFIRQKLADELILFITPWLIGSDGIPFVDFKSAKKLGKSLGLNSISCTPVGDDVLLRALFS